MTGQWQIHSQKWPAYTVLLVLSPIVFYVLDLYYPYKLFKPVRTAFEIALGVLIVSIILAASAYLDRTFILPRKTFCFIPLPAMLLLFLVRMVYDGLFRSRFLDKRTLVIGTGSFARELVWILDKTPHSGLSLVGSVAPEPVNPDELPARMALLGSTGDLPKILKEYNVQLAVIALENKERPVDPEILAECFRRKIAVTSAEPLLERLTGALPKELADDSHYVLSLISYVRTRPYLKIKRIFDIIAAAAFLIVLAPVFVLAIALLALRNPGEIFFVQKRIGLDGKPFKLLKLRSMTTLQGGRLAVTGLGKWFRKYRIDELPQLINVLRGDMSLVGPRPEIPHFVERSIAKISMYEAVFSIKPGITGWAQVKFRYTTSPKDYYTKFRYNLFYLKNVSLVLDLMIVFKTIRTILLGAGR